MAKVKLTQVKSHIGQSRSEERRVGKECRARWSPEAEDGIRDGRVTGVQTCALPISAAPVAVVEEPAVEEPEPVAVAAEEPAAAEEEKPKRRAIRKKKDDA